MSLPLLKEAGEHRICRIRTTNIISKYLYKIETDGQQAACHLNSFFRGFL